MYKRNLQTDFNFMCKKVHNTIKNIFDIGKQNTTPSKTARKQEHFISPHLFQVILEFVAGARQEK